MKAFYYTMLLVSMSVCSQNIIIGDSQVPYIDFQTHKAIKAPRLWKGGIGVTQLIKMVNTYTVDPTIQNVIISIGTNDQFKGSVVNLFQALSRKFPNAKFYIVQGSWGWGGNRNINASDVYKYYIQFKRYGTVISTPIGHGDPHCRKASYILIGNNLDKLL